MLGNYTRNTSISFKIKSEIFILVSCDLHSYAMQIGSYFFEHAIQHQQLN